MAHWPTRLYKKYAAYMGWLHRQELRAAGIDPDKRDEDEDDGTPSYRVVQDDGGGDWESESHTRPFD